MARSPRRPLDAPATARDQRGEAVDLVLVNISQTGFLIRTRLVLQIGETFSIGIPGLATQRAIVRRIAEEGYGCDFETPLTAAGVTRAGEDTVAQLPGGTVADESDRDDHRLSKILRILVIAGTTALLWGATALVAYLVMKIMD